VELVRGLVLALQGRHQEAIDLCAAHLPQSADPGARSHFLSTMAMCVLAQGDTERCVALAGAALAEAEHVVDDQHRLVWRGRALRYLALAHIYQLDLAAASRHAREYIATCRRDRSADFALTWCMWTLGVLQTLRGELSEALASLQQAARHCGRLEHRQREQVALWHGLVLRAMGDLRGAAESLEQAGANAAGELALLALQCGRRTEALRVAEDALRMSSARHAPLVAADAQVVLGIVLRDTGQYEAARVQLEQAMRAFRRTGDRLSVCSALVHVGALELARGRVDAARAAVREAFGLAAPNGLAHFFWWEPRSVAVVCALALREGIWPEFAAELASRRLETADAARFLPTLAGVDAQSQRLAARVVRTLVSRLPDGSEFAGDLLSCATDRPLLVQLAGDLGDRLVTLEGLRLLRQRFGLTWKEIQVFSAYYLRPSMSGSSTSQERLRRSTAESLGISENTLKIHINSVRRKLGLSDRTAAPAFGWAQQEGIAGDGGPDTGGYATGPHPGSTGGLPSLDTARPEAQAGMAAAPGSGRGATEARSRKGLSTRAG
jgi:tetratricopeptide (TPR) repeat protein